MRIVGDKDRSEFELDPASAWRRGRVLDGMLRAAMPPRPRGIARGSHLYFNRLDADRQAHIARRLNAP